VGLERIVVAIGIVIVVIVACPRAVWGRVRAVDRAGAGADVPRGPGPGPGPGPEANAKADATAAADDPSPLRARLHRYDAAVQARPTARAAAAAEAAADPPRAPTDPAVKRMLRRARLCKQGRAQSDPITTPATNLAAMMIRTSRRLSL